MIEALVAVLMMLVILMQRPKSEGLGAAFGGGVTENIFGAQTTNVLTTITTWLASIFFLLVLALSVLYAHRGAPDSALRRELMKTSAPAKAAAPLPAKAAAKKAAADAKAQLNPVARKAAFRRLGLRLLHLPLRQRSEWFLRARRLPRPPRRRRRFSRRRSDRDPKLAGRDAR